MCMDPVSMAAVVTAVKGVSLAGVATAASVASGAVGVVSAYKQGQYQSAAAKQTAKLQEAQAARAVEAGKDKSDQLRAAGAQRMGAQRVAMAANGVDVTSSESLDFLDSQKGAIEADAFTIRENATIQGQQLEQSAANSMTAASSAKANATNSAIGTVLTTGSKVASQWSYMANKQGGYT